MSAETIHKKLFSIEEFHHMLDAGLFPPDTAFELIRGEIVEVPQPTTQHMGRVNKLNRLFGMALGESAIVSVQNWIAVGDLKPMSFPKPDLAILKPMPEFFGPWAPEPDEVLLLVEVADTSVGYDTKTKAALYAEAGIREYWVLNVRDKVLEVRTEPSGAEYRSTVFLKSGDVVVPTRLPGISFSVDEILS